LPFYVLIGGVVYLLMLRILKAVNRADMDLLQGFLGRRLGPLANFLGRILLPGRD